MTEETTDAIEPTETPTEEEAAAAQSPSRSSRTATTAHYLLVASIVLLAASPLTFRTGLLDLGLALGLFPAGLGAAALAILVGIAGIITTRSAAGRGKALTALVGGIIVIAVVGVMVGPSMMSGAPAIHDITTDMDNPPAFVALRSARDAAPNETDYAGGEVSEMQAAAYPAITTFITNKPGNAVFGSAEQIAAGMGWSIAAAVAADGRIEATATTRIYGYQDDVVIRIKPTMEGTTEVDVRSASRVGVGDLGANAARINAFLSALQTALDA